MEPPKGGWLWIHRPCFFITYPFFHPGEPASIRGWKIQMWMPWPARESLPLRCFPPLFCREEKRSNIPVHTKSTKRCDTLGPAARDRQGALPPLLAPGPRIQPLNALKSSCQSSPSMFVPIASALIGDGIHMDGRDGQDVNASRESASICGSIFLFRFT